MNRSVGDRRRTVPFPPTLERLFLGFFLLLAWHGTVIAAEAPSPEEQANAHLLAGNERLDAGDFAAAAAEYRAGFSLYPRTSLLFNLGLAELGQGHLAEAAEAFHGVLERPETTPEVATEARAQLEQLDARLALVDVKGGHGAALSVDGRQRGTLPLPNSLRLLPGPHTLRATKEGHRPFERQISGAAGTRLELAINALDPLPPPPPPKSRRRYWLWGSIGAAVLAGAVIGTIALWPRSNCPPGEYCFDVSLPRM